MSEFIYPDLTNSQFDTPYGRRLALPGDLGPAVGVIHGHSTSTEDPDPPPVTGQRFAVVNEDDLATQEREFDLTGAFNFAIVNGANPLFQIIGSSGQLVFGQYGDGTFLEDPAFFLGVDADGNVIEIDPSDLIGGGSGADLFRFAYATEDDTAGEDRNFNITGHAFSISDGGTPNLLVISPGVIGLTSELTSGPTTAIGSLALNSDPTIPSATFQLRTQHTGSNLVAVDGDSVTETLRLQAFGGIFIPPYGGGSFLDAAPVYLLGVNSSNQMVEVDPSGIGGGGGSGVDMFRFGYPTEDDTAGEDRLFTTADLYQVHILGGLGTEVKDSVFKVSNLADNGVAVFGYSDSSSTAILGRSNTGVGGEFSSTDGIALLAASTNQIGALITSINAIGVQISSDSTYSADLRTVSTTINDAVLPNVIMRGLSTDAPTQDGFGQSLDFALNTTDLPTVPISNQIISKWLTADNATRVSEISITGVDAGVLQALISIGGGGLIQLLLGLSDYANDAAAAAGTPVIPVTGLYRNGSQMMIRVA